MHVYLSEGIGHMFEESSLNEKCQTDSLLRRILFWIQQNAIFVFEPSTLIPHQTIA